MGSERCSSPRPRRGLRYGRAAARDRRDRAPLSPRARAGHRRPRRARCGSPERPRRVRGGRAQPDHRARRCAFRSLSQLLVDCAVAGGLPFARRALLLGLLPVAAGALAGSPPSRWDSGAVHGITLGFGITLIGESVDYSIYFFVQGHRPARRRARRRWQRDSWPTIRLGMLTSVVRFRVAARIGISRTGAARGLFDQRLDRRGRCDSLRASASRAPDRRHS